MSSNTSSIIRFIILVFFCSSAQASLLYYDFTGSVSQINSNSPSSIALGTAISGYVAIDYDNIIRTSNSATFGDLVQYGGSELSFTIGGFYTFTANIFPEIIRNANSFTYSDQLLISAVESQISAPVINGLTAEYFVLQFKWDSGSSPLTENTLPSDTNLTETLNNFSSVSLRFIDPNTNQRDDSTSIRFDFSNMMQRSAATVPEPSTISILGLCVLLMFVSSKRRKF
ncbi:PEP-CTERM sorting domain-containing protein [Colwellia sp. Arc7-D]|uniref:PEP-CTERM sorting domain-containing protein n=1 Tax=Colwellia sp. Arc7-D TaxID=2161872 RepID=UPI000D39D01B|nr:PEP-CTERM sorting domain-containing protein [Colwellia sp. Arc7-D]AWB58259.1 hypothetical protein DBO93_12225 [Colwellia sp. Arc7-D]